MLSPWLNCQVKVQRRAGVTRNALGEPDWGNEASYSVVYPSVWARIEIVEHVLEFTETGERVVEQNTYMFVEPDYQLEPMDRITVLTSDDPDLAGKLLLVLDVHPEWDAVGNVHHYVASLQVH